MADVTSLTPPSPILLKPALGGVKDVARMNRHFTFNKTESDTFVPCLISLLPKDLLFQNLLLETIKNTLYRSGVVQSCHHDNTDFFRCYSGSLGFIKQYIAFHLWQYVGGIFIDSLLSTYDMYDPPFQDVFLCHKFGARTL